MTTPDLSCAVWRTSSRSDDNGGACVEVATASEWAAIRDSKSPASGILTLTGTQWATFRRTVKSGGLDLG